MLTPQIRQWIYTVSSIASALVPLLITYKVLDAHTGTAWIGLLGALGAFGSGTAAMVTSKQRKDGTLDFTGSAPEQAVAAIQATVAQAAHAAEGLNQVKDVVTDALAAAQAVGKPVSSAGPLIDKLIAAVSVKKAE